MTITKVGASRIDLTPAQSGPTTGWGPMGRRDARPPSDPAQRLFATAVALESDTGQRAVLINADLHCGGWHLWHAAAAGAGLDPSRVVLSGTHTHAGPGQRYGGVQYSLMAGPSPTDAWRSHRRLAPLLSRVAREAIRALTPGEVTVAHGITGDIASNRAVPAWVHYDDEARSAFLTNGPGSHTPADAPLPDRLRDPRITVLAVRASDGSMRTALAWAAVHGTSLGAQFPEFGSDLWGFASDTVRQGGWDIGFGGGSSGDISPLPIADDGTLRTAGSAGDRPSAQGRELSELVGRRVGETVAQVLTPLDAASSWGPMTLQVAHEVWEPMATGLPAPMVGMAQIGGGIDGTNDYWQSVADGIHSSRYQARAARTYPREHAQWPKIPVVSALTPLPVRMGWLLRWAAPTRMPLHVIRVGDHAFATVPGEATTMAGWRIEQAVATTAGCGSASVIGYAGDYGGYWATEEEYLEQRYEAAATIYGRDAAAALTDRLAALAGLTAEVS